jgi:hypothetical protein
MARCRPTKAFTDLDGGCLAGPVGAKHYGDRTSWSHKGRVVNSGDCSVGNTEVFDDDSGVVLL